MPFDPNNYTVGRGRLYFNKFVTGTKAGAGERYIGNTPSLAMTNTTTNLDHFGSDDGVRVKDASTQLQTDRMGKFQTDNINAKNIALMFGSDPTDRTTMSATGQSENFTVQKGLYYQLGRTVSIPEGIRKVSSVTMTDATGAKAAGTLTFGGQPTNLDTVTVNGVVLTFTSGAPGTDQVPIGGTATITAQALKFLINENRPRFGVVATGASTALTLTANTGGTGGNSITIAKSGTYPTVSGATLSGGTASGAISAGGNWEVDAAKGRIHILSDAASINDDDVITVNYSVDANDQTVILDSANQVEGELRFIADNAEGDNRDFFWPDVKISVTGDYALKSETWMVIDFQFEVLTLDSDTKRVIATA